MKGTSFVNEKSLQNVAMHLLQIINIRGYRALWFIHGKVAWLGAGAKRCLRQSLQVFVLNDFSSFQSTYWFKHGNTLIFTQAGLLYVQVWKQAFWFTIWLTFRLTQGNMQLFFFLSKASKLEAVTVGFCSIIIHQTFS